MQSYITNNFHGISHRKSTNYILPVRICGGRTRDKSLWFQGLSMKHLHAHFVHVKNPNKKSSLPQSLLRLQTNNNSVRGVMSSPARAAQSVHPGPTPLASSFNSLTANFGPEPLKAIASVMQSETCPYNGEGFVLLLEISFSFRSVKRGKLTSSHLYVNM